MKNMADAIESFIVGQLLAASKNTVMVQRNELADRLSCAPSQISYVLSTRFTPEKGYLVESRRGSGGFIRIVRILPVEEQQEEPTVDEILHYYHGHPGKGKTPRSPPGGTAHGGCRLTEENRVKDHVPGQCFFRQGGYDVM